MVEYNQFELGNGLRVIVHEDRRTPIAAVNLLYDVGARDESPDKTGFAHLFEHLMFGGSKNIAKFDEPLQRVGGDNNAFTSNDITNYYITIPVQNLETALWLESDRMNELAFTNKSLSIQKNVVIEEFRQRYLNQPYGETWLNLRPLAYKVHPYQWPTIGKQIEHIADATMDDVKEFFYKFYRPNNAILSIAGNVKTSEIEKMIKKWFGDIPRGLENERELPPEPKQTEPRKQTIKRDVPLNAIYKAYHTVERNHESYHAIDLLSDVLSRGKSSRFYQNLVKKNVFSEVNAYVTGDMDPGMLIVYGMPVETIDIAEAEEAMNQEVHRLKNELIEVREREKVLNKVRSIMKYEEINVLNKAMNLAMFELLGSAGLINDELSKYENVTREKIQSVAKDYLSKDNSSTLYYLKNDM